MTSGSKEQIESVMEVVVWTDHLEQTTCVDTVRFDLLGSLTALTVWLAILSAAVRMASAHAVSPPHPRFSVSYEPGCRPVIGLNPERDDSLERVGFDSRDPILSR